MALKITKDLTVRGISIPEVYVRLVPTINAEGTEIKVKAFSYVSKLAYQANPNGHFAISGIPSNSVYTYNRETNGNDALVFAHNGFIAELVNSGQFTNQQIVSDILLS